MKRFRFPLQPVAVLRAQKEARAREVFGAAIQTLAGARAALEGVQARVAGVELAIAAGRQGRFSPGSEAENLIAYRHECAAEAQAQQAVAAAAAAVEQRRAEYVDAHRQLEVVHRLEAKARLQHRLTAVREEQNEYDEFASRRASRRSSHAI
jgi:flagellar protein FliJ